MPITLGAIRKQRADKLKAEINLKVKQAYKDAVREMRKKATAKNLVTVFSKVDRAAKSHVIHANKAARLKSRLSKLLDKKKKK